MLQDPNFLTKPEEYMNKFKPEVAYFMPIEGHRAIFIVNAERNDQLPAMAEPLYEIPPSDNEITSDEGGTQEDSSDSRSTFVVPNI